MVLMAYPSSKRIKLEEKKTKSKTKEKEEELTDKKVPLELGRKSIAELAKKRSAPIGNRAAARGAKFAGIDLKDPLRSLAKNRTIPSNLIIEAFETHLDRLAYARSQIKRHPELNIYPEVPIKTLVDKVAIDIKSIMDSLIGCINRLPIAILIKDTSGRMDIIFDTKPSVEYLCATIEPSDVVVKQEGEEKTYEVDEIATVMSLRNRVIAMDELLPLFQSTKQTGKQQTISPSAAATAKLFDGGSRDQGTADTFEKLFMKKRFRYIDHFACTTNDLDQLSATGHSIEHGKIVLTSV